MDRTPYRLRDIIEAIDEIDALLVDKSAIEVSGEKRTKAAFERFLEIISEASRHIPDELKEEAPEIPWRRIADIGNHIRHAYHRVDADILWNIYADGDLAALRAAVLQFIAKLDSE